MKRILWLMALCLSFSAVRAGEAARARKVLDATAALITGKSGVKANFKADNFVDGVLQGSASGTMCLQGEKFHITTPEMVTWYNGETQWSYIKANEEVNVSVPTEEEKQKIENGEMPERKEREDFLIPSGMYLFEQLPFLPDEKDLPRILLPYISREDMRVYVRIYKENVLETVMQLLFPIE